MGRKPKLAAIPQEIFDEVRKMKEIGCTDKMCYDALGIHSSTWQDWKNRGESDKEANKETPYSVFSAMIKKAEVSCLTRSVGIIQKAAKKDWYAAAWWLERRGGDDFIKKDKIDMSVTSVKIVDDIGDESD